MPKVHLKQSFIENPPLPNNDKPKVQYFDQKIPGFAAGSNQNRQGYILPALPG